MDAPRKGRAVRHWLVGPVAALAFAGLLAGCGVHAASKATTTTRSPTSTTQLVVTTTTTLAPVPTTTTTTLPPATTTSTTEPYVAPTPPPCPVSVIDESYQAAITAWGNNLGYYPSQAQAQAFASQICAQDGYSPSDVSSVEYIP